MITRMITRSFSEISQVVIYKGHETHPLFGPYPDNIGKRISKFELLNHYRIEYGKTPWKVVAVAGEHLVNHLQRADPQNTLLVIPAGQSSHLDRVFTAAQCDFLKNEFFSQGGRGYFNCGSAYWVSSKRSYRNVNTEHSEDPPLPKSSNLPLFSGLAEGPLCPYPARKCNASFFSQSIAVTDGSQECNLYLGGGGSFILPKEHTDQKVKILVRYKTSELLRLGKKENEASKWENAVILASVGKGAVLLSMLHPYYGSSDIDVETYRKVFPDSGTDWQMIRDKLSPLEKRLQFIFSSMLQKLELMQF